MRRTIYVEALCVLAGVAGLGTLIAGCALTHASRAAYGRYDLSMTLVSGSGSSLERRVVTTAQPSFLWTTAYHCEDHALDDLRDVWKRKVQQKLEYVEAGTTGTTDAERLQFAGRSWCVTDIAERWRAPVMGTCTPPVAPSSAAIRRCDPMVSGAALATDPVDIRFPATAVGATSAPVTIRINNPGSATLEIQPPIVEWATPAFHIVQDRTDPAHDCFARTPIRVPAGEWCRFQVTFGPTTAGGLSDNVRFDSNAPSLVSRVSLYGPTS